jgi:hypothetical protein
MLSFYYFGGCFILASSNTDLGICHHIFFTYKYRLASAAVVLSLSWLINDAFLSQFEVWNDLNLWIRCGPVLLYSCVVLPRYFMDAVLSNVLVESVGKLLFFNLKD